MRLTVSLLFVLLPVLADAAAARLVVVSDNPQNAFAAAARDLGLSCDVLPRKALTEPLPECSGLVVLADAYPELQALAPEDVAAIDRCLARGTSVYVEFAALPWLQAGAVIDAGYERIYAPAALPDWGLAAGALFEEHQSRRLTVTLPADAQRLLAYGRVAGFDRAVFGAPTDSAPALFRWRRGNGTLVYATTALSNAVRGRYKPQDAWRRLLCRVLLELVPPAGRQAYAWPPGLTAVARAARPDAPGPRLDRVAALPPTARKTRFREALDRNLHWFEAAGMLVAPDGSAGVREGLGSRVRADGTQDVAGCVRVDGVSECALAFYLYGRQTRNAVWEARGRRMMDYVATRFQVTSKDTWYFGDWQSRGEYAPDGTTYTFNDDSGAAMTLCFAFYHFTGDTKYLIPALRSARYFQRTASTETGLFGRMPHRNYEGSGPTGTPWDDLRKRPVRHANPHEMSWPLAGLLYAYAVTGDATYLAGAEKGIRYLMGKYPDWHLTTSRSCEHARMLLPLALLCRYRPTPEVRGWLRQVADFLRGRQDPCGAIQEWDGHNPKANETFGTEETSIFQENGDPVSDQLYDTGFALMNLWYAYRLTGDADLCGLFERLGEYLACIQVRSAEPRLDGTWLRAFDYRRWEYFGSSADVGWGPYCVETGWSCAPIDLGLLFWLGDLDPAPPTAKGTPAIAALAAQVDAEFAEVERYLRLPPPERLGGLRAVTACGNFLDLAWDKPAAGAVARYRVYAATTPEVPLEPASIVATTRQEACLVTQRPPLTEYWVRVVAENAAGQTSAPTPALPVRTGPVSLARGKPYTTSAPPYPGYADAGGAESTDGVYAGAYADGHSYGYRLEVPGARVDVALVLDLGAEQTITRAMHHACGAPGYKPDRLTVDTSLDGKAWTPRGQATVHRGEWLVADFVPVAARYVRFGFTKTRHQATDDWLFLDEIEVF